MLTHFHADYIAGHNQCSDNIQVIMGQGAKANYKIKNLNDGQKVQLGSIKIRAIHTPGHTPQSSCYVIQDAQGKDSCIFSGDTLFLNQVGRPDLAVKSDLTSQDLAGMLYQSLKKLKRLNNDIRLYPGHGAGSSCGKSIGQGSFCTIGKQKKQNYALQQQTKQQFINNVLKKMPKPPSYFFHAAQLNKTGPKLFLQTIKKTANPLSISQFKKNLNDVTILDVRNDFSKGIIKNSIGIHIEPSFAKIVATLIKPKDKIMVLGNYQQANGAIIRLIRIGYENIIGYSDFQFEQHKNQFLTEIPKFITVDQALIEIKNGANIIDFRTQDQFKNTHVQNAININIYNANFLQSLNTINKSKSYVVHCRSGIRATAAGLILMKNGVQNKIIKGNYDQLIEKLK